MNLTDIVQKPTEGYFKIECINVDGIIIETFGHKNMIMKESKASVARSTRGTPPTDNYINKLVLGDKGSSDDNLLVAKPFDFTRKELFAQEEENGSKYYIIFDPLTASGEGDNQVIKEGYVEGNGGIISPGQKSNVRSSIINESTIQYVIDIAAPNANGGGIKAWTEAALFTYTNQNTEVSPIETGNIFAMRTFPAKVKDDTTVFRITWEVVF